MPRCAVCGRDVNLANVAYIRGSIFVCDECFPQYYVREVCRVTQRRIRGESPLACLYCKYKSVCDEHIANLSRALKSLPKP